MSLLIHASKRNPCPICLNTDWCYQLGDDLWFCKRSDYAPNGWFKTKTQDSEGHYLFGNENQETDWSKRKAEYEQKKAERQQNQRLVDLEYQKTSLTAAQRDPLIRALSKDLGLSREHRQILLDRGFTTTQIDESLYFSIDKWQKINSKYPLSLPGVNVSKFGDRQLNSQGIAIVTFDAEGLATGWQVMTVPRLDGAKYLWAKGLKSSKLPVGEGEGELPIQVTGTPGKKKIAYLTEGTLKSRLAAFNQNEYFIGASSGNFSGSATQVKAALEGIETVVITVDGGEVTNPSRMAHWQRQYEFLVSLGVKVKFLWWCQWAKANNSDVDEISAKKFTNAKIVDLEYFLKLPAQAAQRIADRLLFKKLSSLSLPVDHTRSEEYLSGIPLPKSGSISFVSSPCATGKTEQLSQVIQQWQSKYPEGKIIVPGYRNGLLDQLRKRLRIPSYRVGYGQDDAAINEFKKVAFCLDSILKLRLDSIPANSLVVLDEFEAILSHGTLGGTLGNKRAKVQAHLVAILDRVLSTGGAVIGLEDNLTDVSINGLLDLLNRKYPYEILENDVEKFHWDVNMGGGNPAHYIGLMLDRLSRGQKLIVPSTSQRFLEAFHRMAVQQMPHLSDSTTRVDAKTAPVLHKLLADPERWLADHPTQLLLLSPTVESGFSISANTFAPWFDRVMPFYVSLDTRTQIQMLSRDRSNCPRDIFVLAKGAEAGSARGRDPVALLKMRKSIANETSLLHGAGGIPMGNQGEVWNRLDAEFSARSALSAKCLAEYLELELIERGHNVTQVDWEAIRCAENADYAVEDAIASQELSGIYKETKEIILGEENKILFDADGKKLGVPQALAILHSSGSLYEVRQQAAKCLLHERLPMAELTEEFLMKAVTKDRGSYLKQCELTWLAQHPELAEHLDRASFASQIQQPHVLYSQTSKLAQRIKLIQPLLPHLEDLATGREYKRDDAAITAIQEYAIKKSKSFFNLFNLNIKQETKLGKGNGAGSTQNSPIATANKIIKLFGYIPRSVRREGKAGAQESVYAISNFDCPHRQEIYKAIDYKHKDYLANPSALETIALVFNIVHDLRTETMNQSSPTHSNPLSQAELDNISSAADTLAVISDLPVEEAIEHLSHFRSVWTVDFLTLASQKLTFTQRSAIKNLVIQMNDLRLAS